MASIKIDIDENVKNDLQELLDDLGLDINTYFVMASKQAIREQRIPFEYQEFSLDTLEAFKEVEEMKKNPRIGKKYSSVEDMINDIDIGTYL